MNILWFTADHQAFARHMRTSPQALTLPGYERLCREGTSFENAFCSAPLCVPARASMMSGVYAHTHGITVGHGHHGTRPGFGRNETLLPDLLREKGYRCGYFGKWHCGDTGTAADFGFEGVSLPGYGYPYGTPEFRRYLETHDLDPPVVRLEWPCADGFRAGDRIDLTEQHDWITKVGGSGVIDGPAHVHESAWLADAAIRWLEQQDRTSPFFLRVDTWGPHPPYYVSREFADKVSPGDVELYPGLHIDLGERPRFHREYLAGWKQILPFEGEGWRAPLARCYAHVQQVDAALVRLLSWLDDNNRESETVVICTADHGDGLAASGGISNKGALLIEENLRIPLVIRMPKELAGQQRRQPVLNLDLFATALDAAGVDVPHETHSRSLIPLIRNDTGDWPNERMMESFGIGASYHFQRAVHDGTWKYVCQLDGFEELYDLENDPYETHNLAIGTRAPQRLRTFRRSLAAEMRRTGDTAGDAAVLLGILRERE